jgi:hypothetical protein
VAGNLSTSQQGIRLILRKFGFHGATLRTLEHLQIEYEVQKLRAQIPELADGRSRDCHF